MRVRAALAGLALLTSVSPAVVGTASAASPRPSVTAEQESAAISVFVDRQVLPPGGTTKVHAGVWEDYATLTPVAGARFRSTNPDVLRVARDGTVTAIAKGDAAVRVTVGDQRWKVPVQVRKRALWTVQGRVGNLCNCEHYLLNGHGFAPGSPITFTTKGAEGVFVMGEATADASGAFLGALSADGYPESGPTVFVERSGGASPGGCTPGTTWVVTATDTRGTSKRVSGTC